MPVPRRIASGRAAARRRANARSTQRGPAASAGPTNDHEDLPPLTEEQIAELDRRVAEIDDPTRYLVVSAFSRRFVLYYNVESGCFAMNRPEDGTPFKDLAAARAVRATLQTRGRRRKDDSLQLIAARKTKSGIKLVGKPVGLLDRSRARRRIENRKSKIKNS